MKILIIEQNDSLGKILEKTFNDKKLLVTLINDGMAGLNQIRVDSPSLVLIDMDVPTLNGYEILEIMQKEEAFKNIPVIAIANSSDQTEINRLKNLGIKDYVIKVEMTPEEVYGKVARALCLPDAETGEVVVESEKDSKSNSDLIGISVLWVEDDMFLASIVGRKLATTGAKFTQAKSGEEAFTFLASEIPQVIVLDLLLPGMSGFEILEKIKTDEKTKDIPVIVLSNLDQRADMEKCFKLGAAKFFVKALVTLDSIFDQIKSIVKS